MYINHLATSTFGEGEAINFEVQGHNFMTPFPGHGPSEINENGALQSEKYTLQAYVKRRVTRSLVLLFMDKEVSMGADSVGYLSHN
jgi:GTP-binding protein EngB required for normal cell division